MGRLFQAPLFLLAGVVAHLRMDEGSPVDIMDELFGDTTRARIRGLQRLHDSSHFSDREIKRYVLPGDQADYDEAASPHNKAYDLGYEKCSQSARALRKVAQSDAFPAGKDKGIVHLNVRSPPKDIDMNAFLRKVSLPVLSFYATQDTKRLELWIWLSGIDPDIYKSFFSPLQQQIPEQVRLFVFNVNDIVSKIPDLSDSARNDVAKLLNTRGELEVQSASDLERIAILAAHPGIYIDSDVLLVRDILPLALGDDSWAYEGQADFINNAVMKSGQYNGFARLQLEYVLKATRSTNNSNIYQYGPTVLTTMWHEVVTHNATKFFHIMPACFFDGGWVSRRGAPSWDNFFAPNGPEDSMKYLTDASENNPEPFMYHWHGRWNKPMSDSSVARMVEKRYCSRLGISKINTSAPRKWESIGSDRKRGPDRATLLEAPDRLCGT